MSGEPVRFDESSRSSLSDQPSPAGGIAAALRHAAESYGLDAVSDLYNEALRLAADGQFPAARERVQMLLCLSPDDGEALLLQAKVLVALQRFQDALHSLERANAVGASVPKELKRAVEDHLKAEHLAEDERTTAVAARETGELKALRQEARRLRSENAAMVNRCASLEKETRRWAWTTAGVSGVAILFIGVNLAFAAFSGGSAEEVTPVTSAVTRADTELPVNELIVVEEPAQAAVAPAPQKPPIIKPQVPALPAATLAEMARASLASAPGLDDTQLSVTVQGQKALLSGAVLTYSQRKEAERVVSGIAGIQSVDGKAILIKARTEGARHTVKKGDTLSKIAMAYYGESSKAERIKTANKKLLKGGSALSIGMTLAVPPVE